MALIFSFSSIESVQMPEFDIPYIDKLFHFVEYFILGILLARAFSNTSTNPDFTRIFIASVLISSLYGLSDEFHQFFVAGRTADLFDLISDIIGSLAGTAICIHKERISRCLK